jgi:hypothetical protein
VQQFRLWVELEKAKPHQQPLSPTLQQSPPALVFAATGDNRLVLTERLTQAVAGKYPIYSTTPLGFFQDEIVLFWPLLVQKLHLKPNFPLHLRSETEQEQATQLWSRAIAQGWQDPSVNPFRMVRRALDCLLLAASGKIPTEDIGAILQEGLGQETEFPTLWLQTGDLLKQWRDWCLEKGLLTYGITTELYWRHLLTDPTYQSHLHRRFQAIFADDVDEYPAIARTLFEVLLNQGAWGVFTYNSEGSVRLGFGADPADLEKLADRAQPIPLPPPHPNLASQFGPSLITLIQTGIPDLQIRNSEFGIRNSERGISPFSFGDAAQTETLRERNSELQTANSQLLTPNPNTHPELRLHSVSAGETPNSELSSNSELRSRSVSAGETPNSEFRSRSVSAGETPNSELRSRSVSAGETPNSELRSRSVSAGETPNSEFRIPNLKLLSTPSRAQLLREITQVIIQAVQSSTVLPQDIAIISPGIDTLARYTLMEILTKQGIPIQPLTEQRALINAPMIRALLTLLPLVYSGLGRLLDRDQVTEMLVVLTRQYKPRQDPIDIVRAGLLVDHCYVPHPQQPQLLSVTAFPQWNRLGYQAVQSYQMLLAWIKTQQEELAMGRIVSPIVILDRAIQTFLWQGSDLPYDQFAALQELLETAQHYWEVEARLAQPFNPHAPECLQRFIELLREGTITANPYPKAVSEAITLATLFQYRLNRQAHSWQFWLDVGSPSWLTKGGGLFAAGLFLRNPTSVSLGEIRLHQSLLDLLGRAQQVYLCHSELATNGQEQLGPLLPLVESLHQI